MDDQSIPVLRWQVFAVSAVSCLLLGEMGVSMAMGVPPNGWFIRGNPVKIDGGTPFLGNPQIEKCLSDVSSGGGLIIKKCLTKGVVPTS